MDDNLRHQANYVSGQTQKNIGKALAVGFVQGIKLLGQAIGAMFHMLVGK